MARRKNDALSSAVREGRRRSLVRSSCLLLAGVVASPFALFVVLFLWSAVSGNYRSIPDHAMATGDPRVVARALRGEQTGTHISDRASLAEDDPFSVQATPGEIASTPLLQAHPKLREAAASWVNEINRLNPQAILHYDVDAYATLYLFPGSWIYELDPAGVGTSTEQFAGLWQQYLFDTFGSWSPTPDIDSPAAPALVFIDCKSEFSRVMAGQIRVLRTPVTC